MATEVERLEIGIRAINALKLHGISTVAEVNALTDRELLATPNFGKVSLRELRIAVDNYRHGSWGAAKFGEWRDISEIPQRWKDSEETIIIGSAVDGFVGEGRWCRGLDIWVFVGSRPDQIGVGAEFEDATHWMPLPTIEMKG